MSDIETDISTARDDGEATTLMEPLLIRSEARQRPELADLALELTARSTGLRHSLPEGIVVALSHLVRSMNCYYSNLIEGHDTHPVDIERAACSPQNRNVHRSTWHFQLRWHHVGCQDSFQINKNTI